MGLIQDNPRGTGRLAAETVFLALDYLFVLLRLKSRRWQKKGFELNDYLIVVALFFATAAYSNSVYVIVAGHEGQDIAHPLLTDRKALVGRVKAGIAGDLLWCATVTFVKLSVLTFYLAMFGRRRWFVWAVCFTIGLTVIFYVAYTVVFFVQCRPFSFAWNPTIQGGSCWNRIAIALVTGSLNLALDVVVVILPIPVIWSLQIAKNKKVAICCIFGAGILICVLTGYRLKLAVEATAANISRKLVVFNTLSHFEFFLGIICACLPLLTPVASKLRRGKVGVAFSVTVSWTSRFVERLLSSSRSRTLESSHSRQRYDTYSEQAAQDGDILTTECQLHKVPSPPSNGQNRKPTQWSIVSPPAP